MILQCGNSNIRFKIVLYHCNVHFLGYIVEVFSIIWFLLAKFVTNIGLCKRSGIQNAYIFTKY